MVHCQDNREEEGNNVRCKNTYPGPSKKEKETPRDNTWVDGSPLNRNPAIRSVCQNPEKKSVDLTSAYLEF